VDVRAFGIMAGDARDAGRAAVVIIPMTDQARLHIHSGCFQDLAVKVGRGCVHPAWVMYLHSGLDGLRQVVLEFRTAADDSGCTDAEEYVPRERFHSRHHVMVFSTPAAKN
jgi:hypothetical protein